jgi:hypothetical protein
MGILRIIVFLIFAAPVASCAPHIPVLDSQDNGSMTTASVPETQDDIPTPTAQPDRAKNAKPMAETKKPKPLAPKPATAATSQRGTTNLKTTNVGSPDKFAKERAEDERKERHLKQVIEGICQGC